MAAFDEKTTQMSIIEIAFEVFFLIALIISFFTEYHHPTSHRAEKDIVMIVCHNLRTSFLLDALALVPFKLIFWQLDSKYRRLLYFTKMIRLRNGFKYLSHKVFMKGIKTTIHNRVTKIIETNFELANNKIKDNNFVSLIIQISHMVKTFQLILTILCISYFFGIFWFILCDLTTS